MRHIALGVVLVVTASGCGSRNPESSSETPSEVSSKTSVVSQDPKSSFESQADKFHANLQAAYDNVYEKMSDKTYRRRCLIDPEYGFDVTKTDSLVSPFLGTLDFKFRFDWDMPSDSKQSAETFGTIVVVFALQEAKWMLKTFTVPGPQEHSVGNPKAREQQPWHNDAIVLAAEATTRGEAITSLLDEAGYKARKERFEAALKALAEKVAADHLELERSYVALLERQVAFWKREESRLEQVLDSAREDRSNRRSRYGFTRLDAELADSAVESTERDVREAKRRRDFRQKMLVQCQKVLVIYSGRVYPAIVKGQIRQGCLDPSSWVTRALTDGGDVDTWSVTRLHHSNEIYEVLFSRAMKELREQKEVDDTSPGRVRSWPDGDKTIEAEFVRYDEKDVLLKGTDGKRIRLSGGFSLPDAVRLWIAELPESAESSEVDRNQRPPQPHAGRQENSAAPPTALRPAREQEKAEAMKDQAAAQEELSKAALEKVKVEKMDREEWRAYIREKVDAAQKHVELAQQAAEASKERILAERERIGAMHYSQRAQLWALMEQFNEAGDKGLSDEQRERFSALKKKFEEEGADAMTAEERREAQDLDRLRAKAASSGVPQHILQALGKLTNDLTVQEALSEQNRAKGATELPESAESSEVDRKQRPPQPHAEEAAAEASARAKLEEAEAEFKKVEIRLSGRCRTWQDASAKFTVVAEYNGYKDGNVTLTRQEDGREISLPLGQLSEPDRKWVRKQLQSKSAEVAPGASRAEKVAGLRRLKEAHEELASVLDEIAARRTKGGATDSAPDTLQAEANQQRQRASELEAAIKKLEN